MAIAIASGPSLLPINTVPTVRCTSTTITGDTSYPTNGTALTAAQLGLSTVAYAIVTLVGSSGSNNAAVGAAYDVANAKLKCFSATDGAGCPVAETANTTNLSGLT